MDDQAGKNGDANRMKIIFTNDTQKISIGEAESVIHSEVKDWIKDMVTNIKRTKDPVLIRQAEKEFYEDVKAQYNGAVAAECLMAIWRNTKKEENDVY